MLSRRDLAGFSDNELLGQLICNVMHGGRLADAGDFASLQGVLINRGLLASEILRRMRPKPVQPVSFWYRLKSLFGGF